MKRYMLTALERQIAQTSRHQSVHGFHHQTPALISGHRIRTSQNEFFSDLSRLQPSNQVLLTSSRLYSSSNQAPDKKPGFFGNILSNMKQEYEQNKEMQDSLKKFRNEAKKLEESDALKEARKKFETIEGETTKSTSAIKSQLEEKVKGAIDELSKAEALKKAGEFTSNLGKQAGDASEKIAQSGVYKSGIEGAIKLKEEIDQRALGSHSYRPPVILRKRKEHVETENNNIEVNEEATGVELHKDSKFYAKWQELKDKNPVLNKFIDYRMKYEESDNPMVRGARLLTDKIQDICSGVFTRTEISEVLTEVVKMDPNFCKEAFLKECERELIPNILEAFVRGDLAILEDWCYEAPFNIMATPIRQAIQLGYTFHSQILDIDEVDLVMGKMTENGPVLALTFTAQMIECLRDMKGTVVGGDPDKVMRVQYVWVFVRDQTELDPKAAWRLLEFGIQSAKEQFL